MQIVLLVCVFLLAYCYVLYPFLVKAVARSFPHPWATDSMLRPSISIILPVYNEEQVLERCVNALLTLDYPVNKLEIIMGSDGSNDATNDIIKRYAQRHSIIKPYIFPRQRGKMEVLNDLVTRATGEILFFVDADVMLSRNTLIRHAQHYASEEIGGVAGKLVIDGGPTDVLESEQKYLALETSLREDESLLNSTVGLYGGNHSMRRSLWRVLPSKVHDDF